jgi:hypothetical protein
MSDDSSMVSVHSVSSFGAYKFFIISLFVGSYKKIVAQIRWF